LRLNGNAVAAAAQLAPVGIKHLVGKEKLHADNLKWMPRLKE
jgi:hypothetical protein